MARISLANAASGILNAFGPSGQARAKPQLAAMADLLRQLVGDANVAPGSGESIDPLQAPFTLYVNPFIGSDQFVAGYYNSFETTGTDQQIIDQKLKRISNQQMTCGYSAHRPFRTINRALLEAVIITSRSYYTFASAAAQVDCVRVCLSDAQHLYYTEPPTGTPTVWTDGYTPTKADLINFNPAGGGVIAPRYTSISGNDYRKCVIRPSWTPPAADLAADYSNAVALLQVTTSAYFREITFQDKLGQNESDHLAYCSGPASAAALDALYAKALAAFGTVADLNPALVVTRPTEYETVGPFPGNPQLSWDTVVGASPYILNCANRSQWGRGGVLWDGAKLGGLKSFVTAQFTNTSEQNDVNSWEVYNGSNWVTPADYDALIAADPNDTRAKFARSSRHITCINDGFVQEVSIFAIGTNYHNLVDTGGEITSSNGNNSFGGCGALATGYKSAAFPQDKNWDTSAVSVPLTPSVKTNNIRRIFIGTVSEVYTDDGGLILEGPADITSLEASGYSLAPGTQIWCETPADLTDPVRATLNGSPFNPAFPDTIGFVTGGGNNFPADGVGMVGRRVYVRRLVDIRATSERRAELVLGNTANSRIPETNFVLQTDPSRTGAGALFNATTEVLTCYSSSKTFLSGIDLAVRVVVQQGSYAANYANGGYYRAGQIVSYANKKWMALLDGYSVGTPPPEDRWGQTHVHTQSGFIPEGIAGAEGFPIVFDTDTDTAVISTTLGINWGTIFTSSGSVRDQYRSGPDYLGLHAFLRALGFSDANAHTALLPRVEADRQLDPTSATDFPTAPSGGAATGRANWPLEFRRPSTLRLSNHTWEWSGWGNYSKALPIAQKPLSAQNRFSYYFTNTAGGRVVPAGENEDGYRVSPRGLENIQTGAILAVNDIEGGSLDAPLAFDPNPTFGNLTVTNSLDIRGATFLTDDGPYLPFIGDATAEVRLRRLGINADDDPDFDLFLNGSARGNVVDLGSGTAINCQLGNYFTRAMAGNLTFTFVNPPAVGRFSFSLQIVYTSGTLTFPASLRHAFSVLPSLIAGQTYLFVISTIDGGTRWLCDTRNWPTA